MVPLCSTSYLILQDTHLRALEPSSTAFLRPLSGSWIRSRATRTLTCAPMGCWDHRWQLCPSQHWPLPALFLTEPFHTQPDASKFFHVMTSLAKHKKSLDIVCLPVCTTAPPYDMGNGLSTHYGRFPSPFWNPQG